MKKLIVTFFILHSSFFIAPPAAQANPFFGDNQNQVSLNIGQGFNSGELIAIKHLGHPAPFYMFNFGYSQPTEIFRLPARRNVSYVRTQGFDRKDYSGCKYDMCDWVNYSADIFVLTGEAALFSGQRWFVGAGMGLAVQGKYNARLNTKFLIPFKLVGGYRVTDNFNLEIAMSHFSNGDTGTENNVYDFWGLGFAWGF
jgi:hypothetical protein